MATTMPASFDDDETLQEHIAPDTVIYLTDTGRAYLSRLLELASSVAGRNIDGDEFVRIVQCVRDEMRTEDPDFQDPAVIECFYRHLKSTAEQPRCKATKSGTESKRLVTKVSDL